MESSKDGYLYHVELDLDGLLQALGPLGRALQGTQGGELNRCPVVKMVVSVVIPRWFWMVKNHSDQNTGDFSCGKKNGIDIT